MKQSKYSLGLVGILLSTVIISSCGGPSITSIKEPVLGTEKQRLSGYALQNREKTVNANFVISCSPSAKNNTPLNGTLYLGSLSNEYTVDDKVRLFIEINGTRHLLNVISRSQNTSEVGKRFFKSTRIYSTQKSLSFEIDAKLLLGITPTSNLKFVLSREFGTLTKEYADILTLFPDEFESKHYTTLDEFAQKCNLRVNK